MRSDVRSGEPSAVSRSWSGLLTASCLALALSLSACGGGSSGGARPNPTPPVPPSPPPPTPDPEPEPTPNSAEYDRSAAAVGAKAQAAYGRGFTGKGVTIAVVDTGIDLDSPEFAGRISADSKSFPSEYALCGTCAPEEPITYGLDDVQGHGTAVASVALAANNGSGIQGVAYDATLLALKVAGPDVDNYKPGETPAEFGMNGGAIGKAIEYAVDHGAFVINLSIGGGASGQLAADYRAAMDKVRENNLLLVQAVDNFPGDSFEGTMSESFVGEDFANKDWFLYGIRLDTGLNPIEGNGTPGALADRTLAIVAHGILAADLEGGTFLTTGNSFAAPAIAGAAALLKQYWPQLGGKEISEILLTTATDMGDPGPDQIYGVGLLNIEKAFEADAPKIGTSAASMASLSDTGLIVSAAFGGSDGSKALGEAAGQAVALDSWGRDYELNVGGLVGDMRSNGISLAGLARDYQVFEPVSDNLAVAALAPQDLPNGRVRALPPAQFGFRLSAKTWISGQFNGSIDSSDMITGSMLTSSGLATRGSSVNLHHDGARLKVAFASGDAAGVSSSTSQVEVELRNGLIGGYTTSSERGSALGMRGAGAFDIESARSDFVTLGWTGDLGGFSLTGEALAGQTNVKTRNSLIAFGDPVLSSGFRVRAEHGLFGGSAMFGLTSPLKVEYAKLRYTAPVGYDVDTKSLINRTSIIDMAPGAREFNLEAGWQRSFGRSYLSLNAAYGLNSGNVAGEQSAAAWLRLANQF